jgi:hypothetical protein
MFHAARRGYFGNDQKPFKPGWVAGSDQYASPLSRDASRDGAALFVAGMISYSRGRCGFAG